jgi:hypothetical protein
MSIGFLVEEGTPTMWRVPTVTGGAEQILRPADYGRSTS